MNMQHVPVLAGNTNTKHSCNICRAGSFVDFRGRSAIRCTKCGSTERSRILQFIIDNESLAIPGSRVLHLAPEIEIGKKLQQAVGQGYQACDLRPAKYPGLDVKRLDLATEASLIPAQSYDLIIHCHVLEHVMANYSAILFYLQRALTKTGKHLFCVPILSGKFAADFGKIPELERTQKFGQFDHVLRFARDDLHLTLGQVIDLKPYDLTSNLSARDAERYRIPFGRPATLDSNSFFLQTRDDLLLRQF